MFGAYVRAAVGFMGAMLLASLLQIVVGDNLLTPIRDSLGADSLLYTSLSGVVEWLPVIAFVTIILALIARSVTEARLPG